jgi:16S rRNA G527 N7-methylase RsmG
MARRAGFLRNTAAALALANVTVEEADMEQVAGGRFDLVVFRAVSPLGPALVKKLSRLLTDGGVIAAYKGRQDTAEQELAAAGFGSISGGKGAAANGGMAELIPLSVPFLNEERHVALIRSVPCNKESPPQTLNLSHKSVFINTPDFLDKIQADLPNFAM